MDATDRGETREAPAPIKSQETSRRGFLTTAGTLLTGVAAGYGFSDQINDLLRDAGISKKLSADERAQLIALTEEASKGVYPEEVKDRVHALVNIGYTTGIVLNGRKRNDKTEKWIAFQSSNRTDRVEYEGKEYTLTDERMYLQEHGAWLHKAGDEFNRAHEEGGNYHGEFIYADQRTYKLTLDSFTDRQPKPLVGIRKGSYFLTAFDEGLGGVPLAERPYAGVLFDMNGRFAGLCNGSNEVFSHLDLQKAFNDEHRESTLIQQEYERVADIL